MTTSIIAMGARINAFSDDVGGTIDAVFQTDRPREPDRPPVAQFFSESDSAEAMATMTKQVQCSLLKGRVGEGLSLIHI